MKIICVGQNYSGHNSEMKSETPSEPVFFMKPDTAVLQGGKPFYYPDFSKEIHHEVEIVLKISKNGKNIEATHAKNYYEEIGIGIDFTARDLQAICKSKGLPWEKAKAFDGSAPVGQFIPKKELANESTINFQLKKNGLIVQLGNTKDMLFSFHSIISYVSKYITLKKGDLIFTGTPEGVGRIAIGDHLEASIENKMLLSLDIR